MAPRRVFVTGMGVVSPHGDDPNHVFRRVAAAESAVRLVETGEGEVAARVLMAPVPDFDPSALIDRADRMFMARASEMAVVAAHGALEQAVLLDDAAAGFRTEAGVYMGCGMGGVEALDDGYRRYYQRRTRRVRPKTVPLVMANGPAAHLSMRWGVRGPTMTYSMACSSSSASVGEAFRALRGGHLNRALAGGAEAMLTGPSMAPWEALGVVASEHADGPAASCRPFDAGRSGMVLGEGAAVFVLETEEAMEARGATPLAELLGYGNTSDAHNVTEPHADGQIRAMEEAISQAGLAPGDIGYVSAHATGTDTGDLVEVESLRSVFGRAVARLPVSATKAVHGHLVGAAGALELLLTIQALRHERLPPTAHLTAPDPACGGLDLIPLHAREAPGLRYALSNSFAFGGSNAALVVGRA